MADKSFPVFLTHEQVKEIKAEVEDMERMLTGADENNRSDIGHFKHSAGHVTPEEVKRAIGMRKRNLRDKTPKPLTGEQANKAYAYAQKLKKMILENILTTKESDRKYQDGNDFSRAVDHAVAWEKMRIKLPGFKAEHPRNVYDYLMRRIDPDAPREDFERLRK